MNLKLYKLIASLSLPMVNGGGRFTEFVFSSTAL